MSEQSEAIAATFVAPRGMIRGAVAQVAAREVMGAVGHMTASSPGSASKNGSSLLRKGQIGHLSVLTDQVVLFRARRGAFRPKPTEETIASAPRESVHSAKVDKKRIAGVLEIRFVDGSSWSFDVPKIHLPGALRIAAALTRA